MADVILSQGQKLQLGEPAPGDGLQPIISELVTAQEHHLYLVSDVGAKTAHAISAELVLFQVEDLDVLEEVRPDEGQRVVADLALRHAQDLQVCPFGVLEVLQMVACEVVSLEFQFLSELCHFAEIAELTDGQLEVLSLESDDVLVLFLVELGLVLHLALRHYFVVVHAGCM